MNGETLPCSSMPTSTPATPPSAELRKNVNTTTRSNGLPRRVAVAGLSATATLLGIPFGRVVVFTFFLSSALGGVAGVLVGMLLQGSVSPFMGNAYGLKGLAAIILGGMGDITGAVLGGLAMGIGEIMIVQYLNSSYRGGVDVGLLFLVLVIRPTGLLGQQRSREA